MKQWLRRTKVLPSLGLIIVGLLIGYLAAPEAATAQICGRQQATCSYYVTGMTCAYASDCGDSCGRSNCCYIEWGPCFNSMVQNGMSTICGGLCGTGNQGP